MHSVAPEPTLYTKSN